MGPLLLEPFALYLRIVHELRRPEDNHVPGLVGMVVVECDPRVLPDVLGLPCSVPRAHADDHLLVRHERIHRAGPGVPGFVERYENAETGPSHDILRGGEQRIAGNRLGLLGRGLTDEDRETESEQDRTEDRLRTFHGFSLLTIKKPSVPS